MVGSAVCPPQTPPHPAPGSPHSSGFSTRMENLELGVQRCCPKNLEFSGSPSSGNTRFPWQRAGNLRENLPGESSSVFGVFFWGGCFEAILSLAARLYLGTGEQPAELLLEKRRSFFGISPPKSAPPHPCEPSSGAPGFPGWF